MVQCKLKTLIYRELVAFSMIYSEFKGTCSKSGSCTLTHSLTFMEHVISRELVFHHTLTNKHVSASPWEAVNDSVRFSFLFYMPCDMCSDSLLYANLAEQKQCVKVVEGLTVTKA